MQRTVHTPDGRLLAVEDRGDPAGWPVLVHHGTPSSRHSAFYGPYVRDAAERGLRLIGYDRPGFGESSPQPGRTVADCAADVRAICAELGHRSHGDVGPLGRRPVCTGVRCPAPGSGVGYRRALSLQPPELRQLSVPTLMVWGDHDPFGGVKVAETIAGLIPNARVEIVPAGHVPWLGNLDRTAELVSAFVR